MLFVCVPTSPIAAKTAISTSMSITAYSTVVADSVFRSNPAQRMMTTLGDLGGIARIIAAIVLKTDLIKAAFAPT